MEDVASYAKAFIGAFFVNNLTIETFFNKLEFEKITIFGQEGITGTRLSFIEQSSLEVREFYLDLSIKLCDLPQYFSYNNHIMYIGKKN